MGIIHGMAEVAWNKHLFSDLHKREDKARAAGDEDTVMRCWGEYSRIIKEEDNRKRILYNKGEIWDFSEERERNIFVSCEDIVIRPYRDSDLLNFMKVIAHTQKLGKSIEGLERIYDSIATDPKSFLCIIEDSKTKEFQGYISIKDTADAIWECGIELLPECCGKRIGGKAILLFLNEIKKCTGRSEYRAFVEIDNYRSKRCFDKIGAQLVGLFDVVFGDEQVAREFENQNENLITPEIEKLAVELNTEPKALLSKVLDYRIYI